MIKMSKKETEREVKGGELERENEREKHIQFL
jgi:hypothetical protein